MHIKDHWDDRLVMWRQMVLETRAGLEAGVVSSGHAMAAARLDAQRSIAGWASEQIGGLSYLNYVRELSQRIDSDWEGIQQDLEVCQFLHCPLHSGPWCFGIFSCPCTRCGMGFPFSHTAGCLSILISHATAGL